MSNVAIIIDSRLLRSIEKVFSEDEDFKLIDKQEVGNITSLLDIATSEDVKAIINNVNYTPAQKAYLYSRVPLIVAEVQRGYSSEEYNDFIGMTLEKTLSES